MLANILGDLLSDCLLGFILINRLFFHIILSDWREAAVLILTLSDVKSTFRCWQVDILEVRVTLVHIGYLVLGLTSTTLHRIET